MPIAAVPRYLGNDFAGASPGLRFGMYLKLWGVNNRSREVLWTTHDVNYRISGQNREEREFKDENKNTALREATRMTGTDKETMVALADRQRALAESRSAGGALLRLEAKAVAPFTTGLGNEHPLENGFAFLNPYGLPYLPASGVKGVLRQAARELLPDGVIGGNSGWTVEAITALFGKESADGDTDHQRGALSFWDVIPQLAGDVLNVDVMTPHQAHYYQQGETPHESGQPNPINFLTVPARSVFTFHVTCDLSYLRRVATDLGENGRWKDLLQSAFEHAFKWLGFGAKTAVGYGAMQDRAEAGTQAQVSAPAEERPMHAPASRRSQSESAQTVWERARLRFNAKNGTLTAVGPKNTEANAHAPRGAELLTSLPADIQRKVRANEFVHVIAKVRGSELIAVETRPAA